MPEPKIALQLWTIRESLKTPADFAGSMARLSGMGYRAVEPCLPAAVDPAELKRILDDNGLEVCATHGPSGRLREDLEGLIADHQTMGCRFPGTGGLNHHPRTAEGYRRFAEEAERAGPRLAAAGMAFAYHNHWSEFAKFEGRTALELMAGAAAPEHLVFELDVCWVQTGGGDPAAWIRKFEGRAPLVHFKDLGIGRSGKPASMPVGSGNLNWPAIVAACRQTGVRYAVVEVEDEHAAGDPFESARVSLENMRSWGLD